MPVHWVGRSGSAPRRVPVTAVLAALVLAGGLVQLDTLNNRLAPARGSAAESALRELSRLEGESSATTAIVKPIGGNAKWETGTVAIPADAGASEGHHEPRAYLYVAHRQNGAWTAAIEGSVDFDRLASDARGALGSTVAGEVLETSAITAAATGIGSAELSLPWGEGQIWRLTGGPHNATGRNVRPWSSLDFAGPRPGMHVKVRAARGGIVTRPCGNLVQIRHAGGWTTSYYHVARVAVHDGQKVARGALLGYTSSSAKCGGYATGPHVHFSLLRYGRYVSIRDHAIGGWVVREGSSQYAGCLIKGDRRRCAPGGSVYNTGSIGARP